MYVLNLLSGRVKVAMYLERRSKCKTSYHRESLNGVNGPRSDGPNGPTDRAKAIQGVVVRGRRRGPRGGSLRTSKDGVVEGGRMVAGCLMGHTARIHRLGIDGELCPIMPFQLVKAVRSEVCRGSLKSYSIAAAYPVYRWTYNDRKAVARKRRYAPPGSRDMGIVR